MSLWREIRTRFDNMAKRHTRDVVWRYMQNAGVNNVVDLWGGGLFVEHVRKHSERTMIFSAERDECLWPAMRHHAKSWHYEPVYGDAVQTISMLPKRGSRNQKSGAWLDFCGWFGLRFSNPARTWNTGSFRIRPNGVSELRLTFDGSRRSVYGHSEDECWDKAMKLWITKAVEV